ncbi:DMT family transporter [Phreatobacter sp.]|uniref:DMT family transporter n=1 Tax=Phreatobacter sp. TaxID=1966341 RepID=UPI0025CEC3E9|nr:DMT family transporter [Phreatobacter sp.]
MLRTIALTATAMVAFAANSILARLALAGGAIDDMGYTGWRLASGAIVLFALARIVGRQDGGPAVAGSWPQAAALFGYALAFSIAYLWLGAAIGAIVLFGAVQFGMIARAIAAGDRPGPLEGAGLVIAFAALVWLVAPGTAAPSPLGVLLMAIAGLCWAVYSLLGRGSADPLADTAGNFLRCLPVALLLIGWGWRVHPPDAAGLAYAVASGALASGLGYAVWYAVLPSLSRVTAASVQLTVPAIAAAGAVVFIGEALTLRMAAASLAILAGIALVILAGEKRRRSS